MSVREAILGILTLGPTYGHQILFEIQTRLPHRASVNPGQVYSTIGRLTASGHIANAGATADNLPTYGLTQAGATAATEWLNGSFKTGTLDWDEVMDVVLLSCTLPNTDHLALFSYLRRTQPATVNAGAAGQDAPEFALLREARSIYHASIVTWLRDVEKRLAAGDVVARGYSENRPGRGRRPSAAEAPPD